MTELDGTLSELARLRGGSEPIVTLYLDIHWRDEHQRQRVRLFMQEEINRTLGHYLEGTPGHAELKRTLEKIDAYVAGLTRLAYEKDQNGLALFASETLGLWQTHFFKRSFQNQLSTDGFPHLGQLVRLSDDSEPVMVVVPSREGADLYHVSLGDLAIEANLRGFMPEGDKDYNAGTGGNTIGVGGNTARHYEREKKNERNNETFIQKHRRAAAGEVTAFVDQNPRCHILLVGTSEGLAAFERELPVRMQERVIARIPRPREWDSADGIRRDGIVAGAAKAIADHERHSEEAAVDTVVGESLRGGLAVVGPDDVVAALNQGRVHRLVLEEDFERPGWRCDNCDALGANHVESCPYCGGGLHTIHHLGEALVAKTLQAGGEVDVVAHTNKLHSYRGIGAFLRQTAPTGLRGASPPWPTAPGANQPAG